MSPRLNPAPRRRSAAPASAERPKLRLIDTGAMKKEARGHKLVMVGIVALATALFLIAVAQAKLVQSQRVLDETRSETAVVEERVAELEREVMSSSSPVVVVEAAESMGMVRSENPVYLVAARSGG